jgi:hypothetical protein
VTSHLGASMPDLRQTCHHYYARVALREYLDEEQGRSVPQVKIARRRPSQRTDCKGDRRTAKSNRSTLPVGRHAAHGVQTLNR